nr:hypothetical protein Iba_chr04aCG23790 [Ipomoea batatas]GMC87375.1 hypothetical protein Iba_chr04dCG19560 [Ipomoea batatas]
MLIILSAAAAWDKSRLQALLQELGREMYDDETSTQNSTVEGDAYNYNLYYPTAAAHQMKDNWPSSSCSFEQLLNIHHHHPAAADLDS